MPRTIRVESAAGAIAAAFALLFSAVAVADADEPPAAAGGGQGAPSSHEGHDGHGGGGAEAHPHHHGHGDGGGAAAKSDGGTAPAESAGAAPKDPLRDAGVTAEVRRSAIAERAASHGRDQLHELLEVIELCGTCPAAKELAALLAELVAAGDAEPLATPEVVAELVEIAASEKPEPLRLAAARALNAVPESQRPEAAKRFEARRVEIVCVPGVMRWEPKEFNVPAGTLLEIVMRNDDSMQHNLLVVAPGSLSEIGVAADRMSTTAEGKAREYVPDSPKVLHVMGMVEPGQRGSLWLFAPAKPATYPLVCTYPGHWRMMNGKMKVTKPAGE